jgi:hypothetical protein
MNWRCHFRHDWSPWWRERVRWYSSFAGQVEADAQTRTCDRCGRTQVKHLL